MCRRCGERDRRGSNRDRRARKQWLITRYGNGRTVPCTWCDRELTYAELECDRLVPEDGYVRANVVPSCGPCNRRRNAHEIPDGCIYGAVA